MKVIRLEELSDEDHEYSLVLSKQQLVHLMGILNRSATIFKDLENKLVKEVEHTSHVIFEEVATQNKTLYDMDCYSLFRDLEEFYRND